MNEFEKIAAEADESARVALLAAASAAADRGVKAFFLVVMNEQDQYEIHMQSDTTAEVLIGPVQVARRRLEDGCYDEAEEKFFEQE